MEQIPLQAVPSQIVKIVLGGQNCQILIYQKEQGLFVDLNSNDTAIVNGVIALNLDPLVCRLYAGFVGNLIFVDTQGSNDPEHLGLGTRYSLVYLTADEYDQFFQ